MSADPSARILTIAGVPAPVVHERAFVAAGAVIVGDVRLEAGSSVWYNAVLRAEAEPIVLGADANLQDTVVCHVDAGFPLTIGRGVSVGHGAVLHGCSVEDDCLVGMGATVLNGAVIGAGSLVAAGAVVLEGTVVPPGSLVAGVPAKVRRELTDAERDGIRRNAAAYLRHVEEHTAPVD
jgi:carbonic anhydrase/acetyltransferase-like protein (isoleucine patch superfamily)